MLGTICDKGALQSAVGPAKRSTYARRRRFEVDGTATCWPLAPDCYVRREHASSHGGTGNGNRAADLHTGAVPRAGALPCVGTRTKLHCTNKRATPPASKVSYTWPFLGAPGDSKYRTNAREHPSPPHVRMRILLCSRQPAPNSTHYTKAPPITLHRVSVYCSALHCIGLDGITLHSNTSHYTHAAAVGSQPTHAVSAAPHGPLAA